MTALESDLQQADDAVVLQLLANRANQYRAHVTSTREKNWKGREKEPRIITCPFGNCIVKPREMRLDLDGPCLLPSE